MEGNVVESASNTAKHELNPMLSSLPSHISSGKTKTSVYWVISVLWRNGRRVVSRISHILMCGQYSDRLWRVLAPPPRTCYKWSNSTLILESNHFLFRTLTCPERAGSKLSCLYGIRSSAALHRPNQGCIQYNCLCSSVQHLMYCMGHKNNGQVSGECCRQLLLTKIWVTGDKTACPDPSTKGTSSRLTWRFSMLSCSNLQERRRHNHQNSCSSSRKNCSRNWYGSHAPRNLIKTMTSTRIKQAPTLGNSEIWACLGTRVSRKSA